MVAWLLLVEVMHVAQMVLYLVALKITVLQVQVVNYHIMLMVLKLLNLMLLVQVLLHVVDSLLVVTNQLLH